jgi:hypothetical protein
LYVKAFGLTSEGTTVIVPPAPVIVKGTGITAARSPNAAAYDADTVPEASAQAVEGKGMYILPRPALPAAAVRIESNPQV